MLPFNLFDRDMSVTMNPRINELRKAYGKGENIIQILTSSYPNADRAEIIEVAYDIQSGSYTRIAFEDPDRLERYAHELYELCSPYLAEYDEVLDCGAGELTTLSALSKHLPYSSQLLACEISLSRLHVGRRFAERMMRRDMAKRLKLFVADMARLPLAESSVDVVFTSHALEPNHEREEQLLKELLRVARRHLLLFEPSWENADQAVRDRMAQHGYVRDLPQHIEAAGGRVVSVKPLPNPLNLMNPTYCYVVEPISKAGQPSFDDHAFQCPRSGHALRKQQSYWWSEEGGWAYPEIDGIPCLREKHAVLMSHT